MTVEILPIPPIPPELREAAQIGKLVPFIGAGASCIAGCPSWSELADGAFGQIINQGKFSYSQLDQIKYLSPRVKLSIALALKKEKGLKVEFENLLHRGNKKEEHFKKGQRLFGSLSRLSGTFVTTNYDNWLDEDLSIPVLVDIEDSPKRKHIIRRDRRVIHKLNDLTPDNLQPNTVIHLHGSFNYPDDMVLTTQDYIQHYANDRLSKRGDKENPVLTFLDFLFKNRTILFVGYGLEELEILEYVLLKARRNVGIDIPKGQHFLLQGYFSHEYELMKSLELYYLEFGVQIIPFLRDQKNWEQLVDVLEEYARLVPVSNPMILQEFQDMEDLLYG